MHGVTLGALLFAVDPAAAVAATEGEEGEPDASADAPSPSPSRRNARRETALRDEPTDGVANGEIAGRELPQGSEAKTLPSVRFKLYGDVGFGLRERAYPAFAIGALDFFITGDISRDFSVVSENVLSNLGNDGTVFDIDRIYLEWHPKPWLQLRLGRDHLLFGRYLPTYHHPLLFQLATTRPAAVAFERDGGWLAAHQIGLEALGEVDLTTELELRYAIGVGNGRGQSTTDVQSTHDRNAFKALVAQVGLLPRSLPGFEIGISGYYDRIPPGYADPATGRVLLPEPIDEQIVGAHVVYGSYAIDVHAEGYYLAHRGRDTGLTSHLIGGFAQVGVSFDGWTPYARLDGADRSVGDTFFSISGTPTRVIQLRTGVRYELDEKAAFKLEYLRDFDNRVHGATLQAAFGI